MSRCHRSTTLALIIEQCERVVLARVEPPSWMRALGDHVTNQPLRTAVDPQALEAACTLRAAAVMAEAKHLTEARALYQRVLARYSRRAGPTTLTKPTRRWLVFNILLLLSSHSVPIVHCPADSQRNRLLPYRVAYQRCKKQSSCATNAQVCEVTNEDADLLGHTPQPLRRARIPFLYYLLVAQSASGASGMAHAARSSDATSGIQSCADIGWARRSVCRVLDVLGCARTISAMTGSRAVEGKT